MNNLTGFRRLLAAAGVLAAAAVVIASATGANGSAVVKVAPSNLGRVLVDAHGKTLYIWAHDKGSKSTCYGACARYWPALITHGKPKALAGANQKLVGTSRRSNGSLQVTYRGHPLYYFSGDTKAGQTSGAGLTDFGGVWSPVSGKGSAVRSAAGSGAGAGSGGYPTP